MYYSLSYFLPNVKSLFDLGQKGIRRRSKALWLYGLTIAVWQSPLMKLSYPAHFPVKVTGTGEGTFILWGHLLMDL